jgi:hypothetical protein
MPAPWERFASAAPSQDSGPWSRFSAPAAAPSNNPGHEPGLADDVKASASFLGNELLGVGNAVNPINIVKGVYNTVAHPIDTAVGLAKLPGQMYDQYQNGDMEGLAKNIGQLAGNVALAKAVPEAPGAAKTGAEAVATAANVAKSVLTDPAVLKTAAKAVMGYRVGKVWDLAIAAHKALKTEAETAPAEAAPPKAAADVSSKVEISPKISVESASNALGTKPTVEAPTSAGKGYRTSDTLDAETQTTLARAAQSGKLNSLPADQKTTLVNAVKAGDNETVKSIVSQTPQGNVVDMNVANKVAVLVKFAKDHNIDLESIKPEDRQTVADGAVAYAKLNGHGTLPKSGKYKGISDSTLEAVKDQLSKMD